jgi:hypothetical protein
MRTLKDIITDDAFIARCTSIYRELRGSYDKDFDLSSSCIYEFVDGKREWVMKGRHNDVIGRWDSEPTDAQINNAIVFRFNMNSCFIKR